MKKILLPILIAASTAAAAQQFVFSGQIGITASLRPALIARAGYTNTKFEAGLQAMYPAAIGAYIGRPFEKTTPYIGVTSEGPMLGIRLNKYNVVYCDASITMQHIRLTMGILILK